MADNHFTFDRTLPAGFRLGRAMDDLDNAINRLRAEYTTMIQMKDLVASGDAQFTAHVAAYGFSDTTNASAGFGELDALMGKIDVSAGVSGVKDAIAQALARFRN